MSHRRLPCSRKAFVDSMYFSRSNLVLCFGSDTMATRAGGALYAVRIDLTTDGAFQVGGGPHTESIRTLADLQDGTSKTVLASEVLSGKVDVRPSSRIWDSRGLWSWSWDGGDVVTPIATRPTAASATPCGPTLDRM